MPLPYNRPDARFVDWTSRFVVGADAGLPLATVKLERGDLVPEGALDARALRQEYEHPAHRIEEVSFALTDPELREACARRGVDLEALASQPETEAARPKDLHESKPKKPPKIRV